MNSIQEYFKTDWAAMTATDWVGLIITVVVFLLMVVLYTYAFSPANREKFDSCRYIPMNDNEAEVNNERR